MDTFAPLGLSLVEAENQKTTKRPQMSGFKITTCHVEAIKKIRERELPPRSYDWDTICIGTMGHTYIETLQPPTPFRETWIETIIPTHNIHAFLSFIMFSHLIFISLSNGEVVYPIEVPLVCSYSHTQHERTRRKLHHNSQYNKSMTSIWRTI